MSTFGQALLARAALAAALLCFAYAAALLACPIWPLLALVAAAGAWRQLRFGRWLPSGWKYGTGRIADAEDCERAGMTCGDGLILARAVEPQPSLPQAARGIFTAPLLRSEDACLRLLAALFRRQRGPGRLLRAPESANMGLLVAPPGSGKGTGFMIANLRTYRGATVTLDPKGENCYLACRWRQAMGHRVVRLDFWEVLGPGDGVNLLDFIDETSLSAADDALVLASAFVVREKSEGESKHFNDVATTVLQSLILFVACHADRSERDLATVNALLKNPEAFAGAVATMRESDACGGALRLAGTIGYLQDREFASVMSTACRALAFMDSPLVAAGFLRTTFDPAGLLRGDTDVFITVPAERMKSHAAVTRALVTALLRFVVTRNGASEKNKVMFLLDEIAHAGHLQEVETALQLYRGFGVRLWLILQHLGQLESCFPADKGAGVLASTDVQVFFGLNDLKSAEYCSARIGDMTVTVSSGQEGRGDNRSYPGGGGAGGYGQSSNEGETLNEAARRVLQASEILSPLLDGHALIFAHGCVPAVGKLIKYFSDPDFQKAGGPAPARRFGKGELTAALLLFAGGLLAAAAMTEAAAPRASAPAPVWQQPGPPSGWPDDR